ncbi:MAG: transglutaminase family protein [Acidobacteriota bacterium]|nr:MAG: transglutaminase family protein [Acidobacteriota bacterium]
MRLRIEHTTVFHYTEPIVEAYTEMRLHPLEAAGQRCLRFSLETEPAGEVMMYIDRYGNIVHHFDTLQSHDKVVVTTSSEVQTPQVFVSEEMDLSPLDLFDYLAPTRYAPEDESIMRMAEREFVRDDPEATALGLMDALYNSLKYEPGATDVKTTALEALNLGRGVCQDFAHLMLAACRGLGIPARYVSGYLYSPQTLREREQSGMAIPANAASHAWVDVFVDGRGWLSLDPTHNSWQTEEYVRVATGRDYSDVPPTRGVYKGSAEEELSVNVNVRAI